MMKKIAIVTGSRRGIGLATAKALSNEGYSVVINGVLQEEFFSEELAALRSDGFDFHYVRGDISKAPDRERLIRTAVELFGRVDLLVNNAGIAPSIRLDVLETTEESVERLLNVNLTGTFFMCQLCANTMISMINTLQDYQPRIVNISSVSAYAASVSRGEYCISKAGISMVTKLFADRLAEFGIPVFEVRPGIIMTDMTAGVKEKYEKLISDGLTPIKRFGRPEDVADCVLAAVSGRLDFATGQVLDADGGFHIRRL